MSNSGWLLRGRGTVRNLRAGWPYVNQQSRPHNEIAPERGASRAVLAERSRFGSGRMVAPGAHQPDVPPRVSAACARNLPSAHARRSFQRSGALLRPVRRYADPDLPVNVSANRATHLFLQHGRRPESSDSDAPSRGVGAVPVCCGKRGHGGWGAQGWRYSYAPISTTAAPFPFPSTGRGIPSMST